MAISIVGELTADEHSIIVMGAGPSHQLAPAAAALGGLTATAEVVDGGALRLPATWPTVVQLVRTFGSIWQPGPRLRAWTQAQVHARTGLPEKLAIDPPPGRIPRSYQIEGAAMLGAFGSGLLYDDPGTGKTITTVLGLVERQAAGYDAFPALVVCPLSVMQSWVEHVRDWTDRSAALWHGPHRRHTPVADVYVTSYGTATWDAHGPLERRELKTVIADESHLIKNPHAGRTAAVLHLADRAGAFIGLSGTPITHYPSDLWPALKALNPRAWPRRSLWIRRYCEDGAADGSLNPQTEAEFRLAITGQHRRVSKADVLTELPPKVYTVRRVALPPRWRKAYDQMASQAEAEFLDDEGQLKKISAVALFAQLTRLFQLASSAADVVETGETDEEGNPRTKVVLKAPSWKVDELLEIMAERPGQPVVAFAPSRQLMMLAGQAATAKGYRVEYIVGGQTAGERAEGMARFQAGAADLICVTTGAGGVGITLTRSRTAVFLQRPYSLVEALQAEDRLHRIGAEGHESIEIIDIRATNTVDTRVPALLKRRAKELADLVEDERIVTELFGGSKSKEDE